MKGINFLWLCNADDRLSTRRTAGPIGECDRVQRAYFRPPFESGTPCKATLFAVAARDR